MDVVQNMSITAIFPEKNSQHFSIDRNITQRKLCT